MITSLPWHGDWQIQETTDVDLPLATHRSGLYFRIEREQMDERGNWDWSVLSDERSDDRYNELLADMSAAPLARLQRELSRQARALWLDLGYPVWSSGKENTGWRARWTIGDADSSGKPRAVHETGLAISFVYTDVDGNEMAWCAMVPPGNEAAADVIRAGRNGEEVMRQLFMEAELLWEERCYEVASITQQPLDACVQVGV